MILSSQTIFNSYNINLIIKISANMVWSRHLASICLLAIVYSSNAVDIIFKHYYGGDTFDAEIETIYAQKDMLGIPGWEMLLSFDEPLTQLVVSSFSPYWREFFACTEI